MARANGAVLERHQKVSCQLIVSEYIPGMRTEFTPLDPRLIEFSRRFGRRLRAAREALGLTREDVCARVQVPVQLLDDTENGSANISLLFMDKLGKVVGHSVHELLADESGAR